MGEEREGGWECVSVKERESREWERGERERVGDGRESVRESRWWER